MTKLVERATLKSVVDADTVRKSMNSGESGSETVEESSRLLCRLAEALAQQAALDVEKQKLEAEWKKYLHYLRHEIARQLHLSLGMYELLSMSPRIAQMGPAENRQLAALGRGLKSLQGVMDGMIDGAPTGTAAAAAGKSEGPPKSPKESK